jgi:hypothetical protein
MRRWRLAVRVFMMITSLVDDAPTMSTDLRAHSSAMSCQLTNGESSRAVKWPLTPMAAQVSRWASRCLRTILGWAPKELPTK